jgi:hypothetical protein
MKIAAGWDCRSHFLSQVLVAHACNTSYLGGRDQEDRGLKPDLGKQFERPYLEKKSQKMTGVGPEFKPQY